MTDQDLYVVGDVLLYIGAAGVVLFTVLYGVRSVWWRYPEGRALFAKSASLAVLSLLVATSLIFGDYYGRDVVRVVVYGLFAISAWWLTVALIRSQRRQRRKVAALEAELDDARRREAKRAHPSHRLEG